MTSVLVVEDDSAVRSLLRDFLELLGCAVQLATNGREALEHLQQTRPDLVLLDFMMPVMDGRAFGTVVYFGETGRPFRHCGINVGGLRGMGGRFQWKWCAGHAGSSAVALAEVSRSAPSSEMRARSGRRQSISQGGAESVGAGRGGTRVRHVPQRCWWIPTAGCVGTHSGGRNGPDPGAAVVCAVAPTCSPRHLPARRGSAVRLPLEFASGPGRLGGHNKPGARDHCSVAKHTQRDQSSGPAAHWAGDDRHAPWTRPGGSPRFVMPSKLPCPTTVPAAGS
jgi:Response regulator receiver domain